MVFDFKKIYKLTILNEIVAILKSFLFSLREKHRIRAEFCGEKKSFGDNNPEKVFYVIRRQPPGGGLMSNYLHVLGHIKIAFKKNMIPIVDMFNYPTFYNEIELVGNTYNPWEYYFCQPFEEYSLTDVYNSKNVILSSFEFPHHEINYSIEGCANGINLDDYNYIISNYMKINSDTQFFIDEHAKKINFNGRAVLGVSVRGTDYTRLRPAGHPIQPSIEATIDTVRKLKNEWNFDKIFLTSEEEEVIEVFMLAFPGKVMAIERMRLKAKDKEIHTVYKPGEFIGATKFNRHLDKYHTGLEYLAEMVLLSRCDFILSAITSGTASAIFMNGGQYLEKKIFDLGVYPSINKVE